ncbi:ABC transporter ATP-binding protein [Calditerricola yamamurae]
MIVVRDVWKAYDGRDVLRGVSLEVPAGACVAVIGPNGAGKSTLLRVLSGVDEPDRGSVWVAGRPVCAYRRRELARLMAVLPQETAAPFPFTVRELVAMGRHPYLRPLRGETAYDRAVVARVLDELKLRHLADVPVDRLSGGQRQRVALARVMAQEPRVLLLDEPTTHLDLAHQVHLLDRVRRWQRQDGLTVVMVLHDLNLAALYADEVVLLVEGRVVARGRPEEVLAEPTLADVYGMRPLVVRHPECGAPQVLVRPAQEEEAEEEAGSRWRGKAFVGAARG